MFDPWSPPPQPPLHRWQGASGQWHYFSVYALSSVPDWIGCCNYIFARPRYDLAQSREPFYIGEKGDTDRFSNHEKLWPARALGATELHVCFAAKSRWERLDIETDLRNAHWTPLNLQPTRAPEPVNALGALTGIGGPHTGGGILGALRGLPPNPTPPPAPSFGGLAALGTFLEANPFLLEPLEPASNLNALRALGIAR